MVDTSRHSTDNPRLGQFDDPDEPYIPFREVPKLPYMPVRRGNAKLATETVHRWATAGVRGHYLEYSCVGGARCTKKSWLVKFFDQIAGKTFEADALAGKPQISAQRRASAAAKELERDGF